MRKLLVMTAIAVFATGLVWARDKEPKKPRKIQPDKVAQFMKIKLLHSQKVFEGLATEDYNMIAKNAQELSLLSLMSNWKVLQTKEYLQQSTEFRRSTDALTKAGKKENLDAAALAFMDMTMKCVKCHKYVRHAEMPAPPVKPKLKKNEINAVKPVGTKPSA